MRCAACGQAVPPPLTVLQRDCLRVLVEVIDRDGIAPTLRDLMADLDLKSVGHMHGVLSELEAAGWISRVRRRRRGIVVLRRPPMPDFATPELELTPAGYVAAGAARRERREIVKGEGPHVED